MIGRAVKSSFTTTFGGALDGGSSPAASAATDFALHCALLKVVGAGGDFGV